MDAATVLRRARERAGLSLRELAERAGTSHATLAAYESGRKIPSVATLNRIVRRAGYSLEVELAKLAPDPPETRAREIAEVLELAAEFPARHRPLVGRFGGCR